MRAVHSVSSFAGLEFAVLVKLHTYLCIYVSEALWHMQCSSFLENKQKKPLANWENNFFFSEVAYDHLF